MKKRYVTVALAAAMLLALSGCSERSQSSGAGQFGDESELFINNSQKQSDEQSTVKSSDNSDTKEPIEHSTTGSESSEPTDNSSDLSSGSVNNSVNNSAEIDVKMDNELITLPCKVKDFPNIALEVGFNFTVKKRDNGTYMSSTRFIYDDINAGSIYLDGDCGKSTDLSEETVIGVDVGDSGIPISYMGLSFNSTKDDIIRTLGEPLETGYGEDYLYYQIEPEGSVTFTFNDENKVSNIAIFLDIR